VTDSDDLLELTGERFLPWTPDARIAYEHLHRYRFATRFVQGKRVLDIACGEGYGAAMLAQSASLVIGADLDAATLAHARRRYAGEGPLFVRADAQRFALAPGSIDVVVSFETIEHFAEQEPFLTAVKEALTAEGLLIVSTPNPRIYTDQAGYHNPFHERELDHREFLDLLGRQFRQVQLLGQSFVTGSMIGSTTEHGAWAGQSPGQIESADSDGRDAENSDSWEPRYYVALCSDGLLPEVTPSLFFDREDQLLKRLSALEQQHALTVAAVTADRLVLEQSLSWRTAQRLQRTRRQLLPPASTRERLWLGAVRRAPAPAGMPADPYQSWIEQHEPDAAALAAQAREALSGNALPISVVIVAVDPMVDALQAAIDAVVAQTYPQWDLCLAIAGNDPAIQTLIEERAAADHRIRLVPPEDRRDAATAANAAAALATGDPMLFLDAGDLLAPDALFEIATAFARQPATDLLYSDEDRVTADGIKRLDPLFKPDWSPELLLSVDYLAPLAVRRSLFAAAGGFTAEGGGDVADLALRCSERAETIVHLPRVLLHRREGASAVDGDRRPQRLEAHLRRQGVPDPMVRPEIGLAGRRLRATWPVQGGRVSIVIPTKDRLEVLRPCLTSLLRFTAYDDFEVILVDSGSQEKRTHDYYERLAADSRVRIVPSSGAFNYSAANNLGASQASGDFLLFLNNDIEILEPEWLTELVRWAERPDIGAVGAKLLYPDGRVQHAGIILGITGHAGHIFWGAPEGTGGPFGSVEWYRNYSAITGACLMVRRQRFEEVGGFDESYQLVFSDVELGVRLRAHGYRNVYTPFAVLRHHEGASRGRHVALHDMLRGYEHLADLIAAGDPYYNPNLSAAAVIPRLAARGEEPAINHLRRVITANGGRLSKVPSSPSSHPSAAFFGRARARASALRSRRPPGTAR
jgi:GT2 family glycosyltransferase